MCSRDEMKLENPWKLEVFSPGLQGAALSSPHVPHQWLGTSSSRGAPGGKGG